MRIARLRELTQAAVITVLGAAMTNLALADGTEELGDPVGLSVTDGTGYVAAGVGLSLGQPDEIEISISPRASVRQVILYWEGNSPTPLDVPATDTIQVNGFDVTGSFIGGGIGTLTGETQFLTYRADITALGAVSPGDNTVSISGMDFGQNNGAGILVVVDEGGDLATLLLRDGSDRAYFAAPPPEDTTVPQLFVFDGAGVARTAILSMFFADVAGEQSGGEFRPTRIAIWLGNDLGGNPTFTIDNALNSTDGEEWDTLVIPINVPAGETMIQVQALSEGEGADPASFSWITAGLQVPPPPSGGEGCTPGYWKQGHHFDSWPTAFDPDMPFADVFDNAFPGMTLVEVLAQGGGKLKALGRHTVAALLNGGSAGIDYDLTAAEVVELFDATYPGSKDSYETLKNFFEGFNQQGCPLGNGRGNGGADEATPANPDESSDDSTSETSIAANAPSGQTATSSSSGAGGGGASSPAMLLLLAIAVALRARCVGSRRG